MNSLACAFSLCCFKCSSPTWHNEWNIYLFTMLKIHDSDGILTCENVIVK